MKIAGIVLLVLQVFAFVGSHLNGSLPEIFGEFSVYGIARIIGYFIPAILGAILLTVGIKKSKKKNKKDK